MPEEAIIVNTAGICPANSGPGGFAAVIELPDGRREKITGGDPKTTGNRMDLSAVIESFRRINEADEAADQTVTVRTASEYVCNAFLNGWLENWNHNGWKNRKGYDVRNSDLWKELQQEIGDLPVDWEVVEDGESTDRHDECVQQAKAQAESAKNKKEYWSVVAAPSESRQKRAKPEPKPKPEKKPEPPAAAAASSAARSNIVEQALEDGRKAKNAMKEAWDLCEEEGNEAAQSAVQAAIEHLDRQLPNLEQAAKAVSALAAQP